MSRVGRWMTLSIPLRSWICVFVTYREGKRFLWAGRTGTERAGMRDGARNRLRGFIATFEQAEREKERVREREPTGVEMSSAERGLLAEVLIRKSSGTYCMVIGGRI